MSGLLTPEVDEKIIGTAEILEIFKVSKVEKLQVLKLQMVKLHKTQMQE